LGGVLLTTVDNYSKIFKTIPTLPPNWRQIVDYLMEAQGLPLDVLNINKYTSQWSVCG